MLRHFTLRVCCALLGCLLPLLAHAAADVWDGNGINPPNGIWGTGANWGDNTTSGNSDTATFNLANTYTVTFNANPLAIQALTVSAGDVRFTSSGGARTLPVNQTSGEQDCTINSVTPLSLCTSRNPPQLTVGDDLTVNGAATLEANLGSQVNSTDLFLATVFGAGNGTVIADGTNSQLNVT